MPSGRLVDWLGTGIAADRPVAPDLTAGGLGLWYSTDTEVLSVWDGSTWSAIGGGGLGPQDLAFYGPLGTADDAATWQAAIDSGEPYINARGVATTLASQVDLAGNQVIDRTGAQITMDAGNFTMFKALSIDDFGFVGDATITGPGAGSGSAVAIHVEGCNRFKMGRLTGIGIDGHLIYRVPGTPSGGAANRADQGQWDNIMAVGCRYGWEDTPGTGAEYDQVLNFSSSGHTGFGVKTCAGSIAWGNVNCVDGAGSGKGFLMAGGSNHAHGIVGNLNANHNPGGNVELTGVVNGQTFNGIHVYEQGILLDGCKGVLFNGGKIDIDGSGEIVVNSGTGSGENYFNNIVFPGDYGQVVVAGTDPNSLIIRGAGGPGSPGDTAMPLITVSSNGATHNALPEQAGYMVRFTGTGAKVFAMNSSDGFRAGQAFPVSNRGASGNVTLTPTGITLNAPKGGSLVLEPGDTVTVYPVSSTVADVFGSTQ